MAQFVIYAFPLDICRAAWHCQFRMITSLNRYTFQPHHFVLAHDVMLDNVEPTDDSNFDCNKENDTQFTWDFPVNSSNLFHASNTSLESLNLKNAVKSKLCSRKVPLQEQIKKQKTEGLEMMCSLRIEDFAKIGTDCIKLNLDSIVGWRNARKATSSKLHGCRLRLNSEESDLPNDQPVQYEKDQQGMNSNPCSKLRRVQRKLPEIPKDQMNENIYRLSKDPVQASSLIRTPSLAEELKEALLAEDQDFTAKDGKEMHDFPKGFHLNLSLENHAESDFVIDLSDLGSPEQIDPVKKYGDIYSYYLNDEKKVCRKSCCISDYDPPSQQPKMAPQNMSATSAVACAVGNIDFNVDVEHQYDNLSDGIMGQAMSNLDVGYENISLDSYCQKNTSDGNVSSLSAFSRCVSRGSWSEENRPKEEKSSFGNDYSYSSELPPCKPVAGQLVFPGSNAGAMTNPSTDLDLDEIDATHRGCHKFVPRHPEELAIEIGDYIYVQVEDDDLWCEGINLRTKQCGIFPTAYAMDLSLFEDDNRGFKFFVKFLGSIEVAYHKGNDVLCQAINKLVAARRKMAETCPPPLCCLEITEHGVKMTDRSKKKADSTSAKSHLKAKTSSLNEKCPSENDHLFLLKNISFCGYHPKNDKYLGFITKHPLEMRFACHVFQSDKSTKVIAEAIGNAFRKFYQEYLAFVYPTEDIYLE